MIWVFDKAEVLQSVLTNDSPNGCPYWNDSHSERVDDGSLDYTFSCSADHEAASWLEVGGYVAINDLDNNLILFQIRQVEQDSDDKGHYYIVSAENAAYELLGSIIRPTTWNGYTITQAVDAALNGTRWTRGETDFLGTQTLSFTQMTTAYAALQLIRTTWGGEFRFRVIMQGSQITGRYIDVLKQRGQNTMKRFEYRRDMKGVRRTVDMSQLATALIGQGKADGNGGVLTFSSVVWTTPTNPANKPNGQDWIGDNDALQQFGRGGSHIYGIYSDPNQTNAGQLLTDAYNALQTRKVPAITYEISAVLLERIAQSQASTGAGHTYEQDKVRLGDTVAVVDTEFNPPLSLTARVMGVVRSYSDPTQDSVTLGQFRPWITDKTQIIQQLQAKIATLTLSQLPGVISGIPLNAGGAANAGLNIWDSIQNIPLGWGGSNPTGHPVVEIDNVGIRGYTAFGSMPFHYAYAGVTSPYGTPMLSGDTEIQGTLWLGAFSGATNGYTRLPNGLLLQWVVGSISVTSGGFHTQVVNWPIAFNTLFNTAGSLYAGNSSSYWINFTAESANLTGVTATVACQAGYSNNVGFRIWAIGK